MTEAGPWAPSRRVYLRRMGIVSALTFVFFLVVSSAIWALSDVLGGIGLLLPVAMTLIFVIEDFSKWRAVRQEEWCIEDAHLVHDGPDGRAMIALSDVASARVRAGGAVVVSLRSGKRVLMRYLPAPDAVAERISALVPPA